MEQFDKVDENDQIIGTTNKADAHTLGHIHRIVAVYVFDATGKLYVQHHLKAGLMDHSVGGHVTKKESYNDAAIRETQEEIGLSATPSHIGTFYSDETYTGSEYRHMTGLFVCTASDEWSFVANEEVNSIELMSLSDIVERMNTSPQQFTPGFLNSMEYYLGAVKSDLKLDLVNYRASA